ncbi:MAG: peptide chain release factor-like protein [Lentisphaeria bacterium]|nr:peptide chain release factor-like protein [Lentisphaeria bacterium]
MERDQLLVMDDGSLSALCRLEFCRGSGNGGQKRNKTSSAARVVLLEDERFAAEDCSERSQHRNRTCALWKLRRLIAFEVRVSPAEPPPRIGCAMDHAEYPLNLAHLIDVLEAQEYDHKKSAELCGVSTSAFLKLLRRDDELWTKVNSAREARGLYKLKIN